MFRKITSTNIHTHVWRGTLMQLTWNHINYHVLGSKAIKGEALAHLIDHCVERIDQE